MVNASWLPVCMTVAAQAGQFPVTLGAGAAGVLHQADRQQMHPTLAFWHAEVHNSDDNDTLDNRGGDESDDLPVVSIPQFNRESRVLLKGVLKDCVELRKALDSG